MAKVMVDAGICGFKAEIEATTEDMQNVKVNIKSDCKDLEKFSEMIKEVDAFHEIEPRDKAGKILNLWPEYLHCSACPVPSGIIKAVEITAGLALPKNAEIKLIE